MRLFFTRTFNRFLYWFLERFGKLEGGVVLGNGPPRCPECNEPVGSCEHPYVWGGFWK